MRFSYTLHIVRPWRSLEGPGDIINVERDKIMIDAADKIMNKFALPRWKHSIIRSFMVWCKVTCMTPVTQNPPTLAVWAKYWRLFNIGYIWKYCWKVVVSGAIFTIGNHKMGSQEVERNEIPPPR
jgi:hypothetical protein